MFDTEKEVAQYCKPTESSASAAASQWYVVWAGRQTGILSQADCLKVAQGFQNAVVEGPLSRADADRAWGVTEHGGSNADPVNLAEEFAGSAKAASPKKTSGAAAVARDGSSQLIKQKPSEQDLEEAYANGQREVFVCVSAARIALSWADAAKGLTNPVITVKNTDSDLFLNYARAECMITDYISSPPRLSVAQRLAAAREKIQAGAAAKPVTKSLSNGDTDKSSAASTASQSKSSTAGQSGIRVGSVGLVRTREISHIMRCFVDADEAIIVKPSPYEPKPALLAEQMPAPGSTTYLHSDVSKHVRSAKNGVTLDDFLVYKKNALSAWPLMKFSKFMQFCRTAQDLCHRSSKPVAAANAVIFSELMDIAIRAFNEYENAGTLGKDQIRFSVRMYLHLQYATNNGHLHTGTSGVRAYKDAVDTFGLAKVPSFRSKQTTRVTRVGAQAQWARNPLAGCYLCPSAEHYASDEKVHPRNADGSRPKVPEDVKAQILRRVDAATASEQEKDAEKKKIKEYWAKHNL